MHIYFESLGKSLETGDTRGVYTALHKANKFDGAIDRFGKLFLSQLSRFAQFGNSNSKAFLQHGV